MEELKNYDEDTIYHRLIGEYYSKYNSQEALSEIMAIFKENAFWGMDEGEVEKRSRQLINDVCSNTNDLVATIISGIYNHVANIAHDDIVCSYIVDVGYDESLYPKTLYIPLQLGHFSNMQELMYLWTESYTTPTYCSGHGFTVNSLSHEFSSDVHDSITRYIYSLIEHYFTDIHDDYDEICEQLCDENESLIDTQSILELMFAITAAIDVMEVDDFFESFKFQPFDDFLTEIKQRGYAKTRISTLIYG